MSLFLLLVIFHPLSGLLKDEISEVDLAGPCLPALKAMLENDGKPVGEMDPKYGRLIHGLLSACLQNIDDMRSVDASSAPKGCQLIELTVADRDPSQQ